MGIPRSKGYWVSGTGRMSGRDGKARCRVWNAAASEGLNMGQGRDITVPFARAEIRW